MGILYAGDYVEDDFFYVAYNMHWMPHEFALPALPGDCRWRIALDTGREGAQSIYPEGQEVILEEQRQVTVPERTILVLVGK